MRNAPRTTIHGAKRGRSEVGKSGAKGRILRTTHQLHLVPITNSRAPRLDGFHVRSGYARTEVTVLPQSADFLSPEKLQLFMAGLSGLAPEEVRKAKVLYLRNAISEYEAMRTSLQG